MTHGAQIGQKPLDVVHVDAIVFFEHVFIHPNKTKCEREMEGEHTQQRTDGGLL